MKRALAVDSCLFLACLTLAACGSDDDDDGGSRCPAVAACGGDVIGQWTLTEACNLIGSGPAMLDDCPDATAQTLIERANGTIIFEKDTFSRKYEFLAKVEIQIPGSCKSKLEVDDCADLGGVVDDIRTICSTSASGDCTCEASAVTQGMESGVYRARNNQLELPTGNEDYCVSGNQLSMSPRQTMNMGNMGEVTLELRTTAKKQ